MPTLENMKMCLRVVLFAIASLVFLSACGGGGGNGGSVIIDPNDPNNNQNEIIITTSDGAVSVTFARTLFAAGTEVKLSNIISNVSAEGIPEGRKVISAFEFVKVVRLTSADEDDNNNDQLVPDPDDIGGNVTFNLILYNSLWPSEQAVPVYKWNSTLAKWEDSGFTATTSIDLTKASLLLEKFGRYALLNPLPSELPPPQGVFVKLVVATQTAVILDWPSSDYTPLAGYNLYVSNSVDGEYSIVNDELLTKPGYRQVGVEPGIYYYYVTLVNEGNLEGLPGPVTSVEVKGTDFYSTFGNYGSPDAPLEKAKDIAILPLTREVVVVDETKKRLVLYSLMGVFKREIGVNVIGGPDLNAPNGIGVSQDGKLVYVVDNGKDRVTVMNQYLNVQSTFGGSGSGEGDFSSPFDAAVRADGVVFVSDTGNNRIQYFTPSGTYLGVIGNFGDAHQLLTAPTYLTFNQNDTLFVNDTGNNRIVRYTIDLAFDGVVELTNFGNASSLNKAAGLAVDGEGRLYVADSGKSRILVTDSTGAFEYLFGSLGSEQGEFGIDSPQGLAFDLDSGLLFSSDTSNKRVNVFQP